MRSRNSENAASAPSTFEQIPGLGVVRARGLRKAGISSIAALRRSTPERLAAAPGMTAIKAAQVLSYLSQFDPVTLAAADDEAAWLVDARKEIENLTLHYRMMTTSPSSALAIAASRSELLAITLITGSDAEQYRGKLMRDLARYIVTLRIVEIRSLSDKISRRALKTIQQGEEELHAGCSNPSLDKKTQNRLSETLSRLSDTLLSEVAHHKEHAG